jgi:hypothetical protein
MLMKFIIFLPLLSKKGEVSAEIAGGVSVL